MKIVPTSDDLKASGFTKEQIRQFLSCQNTSERLKLLERRRAELLDNIHKQEQQISTLDYLTRRLS